MALTLLLGAYLAPYLWKPDRFAFLDHVDLAIHEAGHPILGVFGEFAGVAGGTVLQLLLPAAFVVYFWRSGQRWAAFVVLLWVAQSMFNVARYAGDARAQLLPLVGGEFVVHDWAWMLGRLGWLEHDQQVAGAIRALGELTFVVGLSGALAGAARPGLLAPRVADASPPPPLRGRILVASRWRQED